MRPQLGRVLVLLLANERKLLAFNDRAIDRDLRDIFATRHVYMMSSMIRSSMERSARAPVPFVTA